MLLTDWSTIGISDCKTLATLNLMLGTLIKVTFSLMQVKPSPKHKQDWQIEFPYLSFDAVTTTGKSLEQVISDPITGASKEIACRTVIRYR